MPGSPSSFSLSPFLSVSRTHTRTQARTRLILVPLSRHRSSSPASICTHIHRYYITPSKRTVLLQRAVIHGSTREYRGIRRLERGEEDISKGEGCVLLSRGRRLGVENAVKSSIDDDPSFFLLLSSRVSPPSEARRPSHHSEPRSGERTPVSSRGPCVIVIYAFCNGD